jgi:myo-inositol-1(or 4)-monophosphatase
MNKNFLSGDDINFFIEIVKSAGDAAFRFQKNDMDIYRKDDRSIVTEADLQSQNFLIKQIESRFSDFNFICEENFSESAALDQDRINVIIDPIDGTAMFTMHLPFWCVSVGVFAGAEPAYGFVYSPGCDLLFYTDNNNSFLNEQRLEVDHYTPIEKETNIFYSSEIKGIKINFPGKARNQRSTALHACLTTDNRRNRLLAFIGKSYLWDWAGAIPVVEKAGGKIRYLDGREIDYGKIAANGFELEDYAVVYNCSNFEVIKSIFKTNPSL